MRASFAKFVAIVLPASAAAVVFLAIGPAMTPPDEARFDSEGKLLQASFAAFSTKTSDVLTFDIGNWSQRHEVIWNELRYTISVTLPGDYEVALLDGDRESDKAKKCELYALARDGATQGHGYRSIKASLLSLDQKNTTLRDGLQSVQHDLETQLLDDQLNGGRRSATLRLKLDQLRAVLALLNQQHVVLSAEAKAYAGADDDVVTRATRAHCPDYASAAPSAKPNVSPPPKPSSSPLSKPSTAAKPSASPSNTCPPGYVFISGSGCLIYRPGGM